MKTKGKRKREQRKVEREWENGAERKAVNEEEMKERERTRRVEREGKRE